MKSVAICLLWCGVLYAAPLFGACVGSYVYVSPFERCMNDSAAKLAACTDSDYRCNEARVIREYDCKAAEGRRSARKLKISERARNTIWANYPEMQGAIDLINEDENLRGTGRTMSQFIEYALYPNQGISNRNNIAITTRKVPREDMRTPQYWLLLKIYRGRAYNLIAGRGVPPPPPSPLAGWYFARGLRDNSPDNESDLLKALYIAATGSPEGAEPIINGTFMDVPGVRERAEVWRRNSPRPDALSQEGAYHLAYLLMTLVDRDEEFGDAELVDLSLGMLPEYYLDRRRQKSEEMNSIYKGGVASRLVRAGKLACYHYRTNNMTSFPLNPDFRR